MCCPGVGDTAELEPARTRLPGHGFRSSCSHAAQLEVADRRPTPPRVLSREHPFLPRRPASASSRVGGERPGGCCRHS